MEGEEGVEGREGGREGGERQRRVSDQGVDVRAAAGRRVSRAEPITMPITVPIVGAAVRDWDQDGRRAVVGSRAGW